MRYLRTLTLSLIGQEIPICTATQDQIVPVVASDGAYFLCAWEDYRTGITNSNIYGQVVDRDGSVPAGIFALCTMSGNQKAPAIARGSSHFLTIFYDQSSHSLYGRFATSSDMEGSAPFSIAPASGAPSSLKMASDGSKYLIVWTTMIDPPSVMGMLYNEDDFSAPFTFTISDDMGVYPRDPAVAWVGDRFITVWAESSLTVMRNVVVAKYFDSDGASIGDKFYVDTITTAPYGIAVAAGDSGALAVYYGEDPSSGYDIYGTLIIDSLHTTPIVICSQDGTQQNPDVAFGRNAFLVVYEDYSTIITASDIRGRFVSVNGLPIGGTITMCESSGTQLSPRVASIDSTFLIVWSDRRSGYADIYGIITSEISPVTFPLTVERGWNMISLPVVPPNNSVDCLLSGYLGAIYHFNGLTYDAVDSLKSGFGYFALFPTADTFYIEGYPIEQYTIAVHRGWNQIGSASPAPAPHPYPTDSLALSSAELSDTIAIVGSAYWYNPSSAVYDVTDYIRCGRGYWVLIDGVGEMAFPSSRK